MAAPRRPYVDWLRGVAVLCMIEWHVLDSWTVTAGRDNGIWAAAQLVGGMAAPLFLFLAGVAVPFAIQAQIRRGATPGRAAWLVQRRGWEVFGIAHLFRLQSFLINPHASWSALVAPDILNILGLGLAVTAWLTSRASSPARRVTWLLVPAIAVVAATPFAPHWWWPTLLPNWLEAYVRPTHGLGLFRLFPSVAFVPFGAVVGLALAGQRDEAGERRLHWILAGAGAGIAALGFGLGSVRTPAFAPWAVGCALPVIQAGLMTMGVWGAWGLLKVWDTPQSARVWAPMLVLGRTSLFVYWVHVELAYGVWSLPLHHALPLPLSLAGVALVVIAMYFAARWWSSRPDRPWIPVELRPRISE